MNIPFACVFVALLLIYVPKIAMFAAATSEPGGYDNRHPRVQQSRLSGLGARATGAHLNGFEAFAPFAVAVIFAQAAHVDPIWITRLCIAHVVFRAIYIGLYLGDVSALRSTVWGLSFAATSGLFLFAICGN